MKVLKSLNSLYVEGSDSYTFIDSLVSNSINENEYKFSYLSIYIERELFYNEYICRI